MNNPLSPTVWILKEQAKNGEPIDYGPAMQYGELEFVTSHDPPLHHKGTMLEVWQKAVNKFAAHYHDERDFIIASGRPDSIFMVGYMLAMQLKQPRFLVWRREENAYRPFIPVLGTIV